jgi:hypothetical protein
VDGRILGPAIVDGDKHVHVRGVNSRVIDEYIKIAVLAKHSGIEQLIFGLVFCPRAVGVNEVGIRKFTQRILIEHL